MTPPVIESATAETVKEAVTAASVLRHIRSNRVEYAIVVIMAHLLGASDRLLAHLNGVCF